MKTLLGPARWAMRRLGGPIVRRIDAHLVTLIRDLLHHERERSVTTLGHLSVLRDELIHHIGTLGARVDNLQHAERFETQLLIDGVVRELIRLQHQVDALAEAVVAPVDELAPVELPQREALAFGPREAQVA